MYASAAQISRPESVSIQNLNKAAAAFDARRAALANLARFCPVDSAVVATVKRDLFADGDITRDEADALFALERAGYSENADWRAFFVTIIVDHVLWQTRPSGIINEAKAEWLIRQADQTRTPSSFVILVAIAEEAHRLTPWFSAALRGRAAKGWPGIRQTPIKAASPHIDARLSVP